MDSSCLAKALYPNNHFGSAGTMYRIIPNMLRTVTRGTLSHSLLRARHFSSLKFDDTQLIIPGKTSFSHQWLRDSCQCPSCVHPSTLQKLHRSSDIPVDTRPVPGGLTTTSGGVHIRWIDGHESFYETAYLERYSSPSELRRFHRDTEQILWNASSITQTPDLYIPYQELLEPSRLLAVISQLTQYGLLFVTGVPNKQTSNDTCELRTLANIFGELRTTFYGGLWDVKNVRNSRNIAYTNLDLGLHMDLLYFQHPPRYQILHCLRNRVIGGTSIFVDAIHAASLLRQSHPVDFDILAATPVPFHYINDGHHLHHEHPTIELDAHASHDDSSTSELPVKHINYSPPFQAPFMSSTPPSFYAALGKFVALLDDTANCMNIPYARGMLFSLTTGECCTHARLSRMGRLVTKKYAKEKQIVGSKDVTSRQTPFLTVAGC
ncbi:gamma-butyrobetaine dioxygenase [Boletus reticuloceps]|uniref:Gamma-butyrobetaine dioxygenase n=1 Tax=Boletus reticuloceps TaxID=495285 RepID=A0A8I2YVI2_9AGAM|nr:gamma-butyrobetaine dioxygenase [Boletus reticuloceps]